MTTKNFWLSFNRYLLIFLTGGFLGWVIEFIYRSILRSEIQNPGFLSGPFLPIYGFGLILLTLVGQWKLNWPLKIFIFSLFATLLELFSGWAFQYFFHLRLWDYTTEWANVGGWICPLYYFYWVIIALIYYFILDRLVTKLVNRSATSRSKMIIAYIVLLLVLGDAGHSFHVADQIRTTFARYGYSLPVLTDYKIFQPKAGSTGFFRSLGESISNFSNFDLLNKLRQK